MSYSSLLEDTVSQLGGCGLYQWTLSLIVQVGKTIATWSMIFMAFGAQINVALAFLTKDPGFKCSGQRQNISQLGTNSSIAEEYHSVCNSENSSCTDYTYDDHMSTVVSEFDLVCDQKWVPATITTIQMGGVLLGCLIAGHVADHVGRKPTYFISVVMLIVFNLVGYFSVSWQMYAAIRFFIGLGIGFYLTVQFSFCLEFAASKWRPVIVAMPSFSLQAALFGLVAWLLPNWAHLHLAIAIVGVPILFTWWIVPESFRWLMTKQKFEAADHVIGRVAKVNRRPKPNVDKIVEAIKQEKEVGTSTKQYSAIDLFRSKGHTKTTLGLLFIWFAASYGYYGITFGVKSLSGNLYLNIFLINIVEAPGLVLAAFLVNWIGRKKTCVMFYVLGGLSGIAVGILQYIDSPVSGQVTNIIALVAKIGVAVGWQAMIVYTTEVYPTVIRTIAYGVHSTSARAGGMLAPQIVFLDELVPGLLYFLSGIFMMASAAIFLTFRETKGAILQDSIGGKPINKVDVEIEITEKL